MVHYDQKDQTLNKIKDIIIRSVSPDKIILFGSRARGDNKTDSDYDILIIKDTEENERRLTTRVYRELLEEHILSEVDLIAATPQKMEKNKDRVGFIYRKIYKEGVVLYE